MMARFAANTGVSVAKSRSEIEHLITRYGATATAFMNEPGRALIMFQAQGRRIVFDLPLPDQEDRKFTHGPRGRSSTLHVRATDKAMALWEQACRQRWRALALVIKAKLEAVDSGITTLEKEFYANIVMPNGQSIYDATSSQVEAAYKGGKMVPLLPDYSKGARS